MAVAELHATSTAAGPAGRAARCAAIVPAVVAVTAAGVGWLYVLRTGHVLGVGPRVGEALPLERLARDDAQPLARLLAAWLPAGVVAGLAMDVAWRIPAPARAIPVGAIALVTLVLAGVASDAVTANLRFAQELGPQYGRAATWLAALLMALGALMPLPSIRRATAGRGRAKPSTRPPAGGPGAA